MDMYFYLNRHYLIVLAGLFCGIMSILTGGFGIVSLDKLTHFIVFVTVIFEIFYLSEADSREYKNRCIILMVILLIYSILINPYLALAGFIIQSVLFFIPNPTTVPQPDYKSDSPLKYGLRNMPPWRIIICFVYALFLILLKVRLYQS